MYEYSADYDDNDFDKIRHSSKIEILICETHSD